MAAELQTSDKVHWRGFISTTPETWRSQQEDTSLNTIRELIQYDKLWEFISEVHLIISAAIFDYQYHINHLIIQGTRLLLFFPVFSQFPVLAYDRSNSHVLSSTITRSFHFSILLKPTSDIDSCDDFEITIFHPL